MLSDKKNESNILLKIFVVIGAIVALIFFKAIWHEMFRGGIATFFRSIIECWIIYLAYKQWQKL